MWPGFRAKPSTLTLPPSPETNTETGKRALVEPCPFREEPSVGHHVCITQGKPHMNYRLNSLKGGYIGDYIVDYYKGY